MRVKIRVQVLTALSVVASLVIALGGCSAGERVDLGDQASGNLIAAIAGEPDQLDPEKTSAYFSFEVLENVFDTLVEPDENLEMRPALAESWSVTTDQLTWTFQRRRRAVRASKTKGRKLVRHRRAGPRQAVPGVGRHPGLDARRR